MRQWQTLFHDPNPLLSTRRSSGLEKMVNTNEEGGAWLLFCSRTETTTRSAGAHEDCGDSVTPVGVRRGIEGRCTALGPLLSECSRRVGGTGLASGTTLSAQGSYGQGARKGRPSSGTRLAVTLGGLARVLLKAGWAGLKQNGPRAMARSFSSFCNFCFISFFLFFFSFFLCFISTASSLI